MTLRATLFSVRLDWSVSGELPFTQLILTEEGKRLFHVLKKVHLV